MRAPEMDLFTVARAMGIVGKEESWRLGWDGSSRSAGKPPAGWLERESIEAACEKLSMSLDNRDSCLETLAWITASPARVRAAWHCFHDLFLSGEEAGKSAGRWPQLLGTPESMFYAVVLLSGLPVTEERHRTLGIPPATTAATLRDMELWIEAFRAGNGRPGMREVDWLKLHFTGKLYQIGRLQFEIKRSEHPLRVLRQRRTSAVLVLADAGLRFRADGNFADADGGMDGPDPLTTCLDEDTEALTGFPVSPEGRLRSAPVTLRRDEWECVMRLDDPVLGVHIPAAGRFHGPMDPLFCGKSFRDAGLFFEAYFPGHRFRGFTCTSWLLDGELPRILPPESNIVRFQKRFHLVPVPGATDAQIMERVFGGSVPDWSRAPQDTGLRRAVAQHMLAGGQLRSGGGIILKE